MLFLNLIRLTIIAIKIIFIAFYIGQYWFAFVYQIIPRNFNLSKSTHKESHEDFNDHYHDIFDTLDSEVFNSFLYFEPEPYGGGWDLRNKTGGQLLIIMTYFSMTSLSTVGFGDYHPRNNIERIVCAFLLLFGVMIFSYFMGKLQTMIMKIKMLDQNSDLENELQKFFILLTQFNDCHPINKNLQRDICDQMNFIWNNNRNMFLDTRADRDMFN